MVTPRLTGKPTRVWIDVTYGEPPDVGDLLRTEAGTYYLVQSQREVKRRTPGPPKFALGVLRLDRECTVDAVRDCRVNGGQVIGIRWHTRKRRPR